MKANRNVEAVVIGAGPYGLAIAAHLSDRGVNHRVFGTPMGGWVDHMPVGMFLKSTASDSSIGSPHPKTGIGDWCAAAGVEPYDKDGGEIPIPIDDFIEYGRWFQQREVPALEQEQVAGIDRVTSGFEVELASGELIKSATVVAAMGTAPFPYMPPELPAAGDGAEWACGRISHSRDHRCLSGFSGKTVAVIGRGQSALETAVLLRESGATVHLLVRSPDVVWAGPPEQGDPGVLEKLRTPPSKLGAGWPQLLVTRYVAAYRYLPDRVRLAGLRRILGPFGAWWLRGRFEGVIDVHLQTKVNGAVPQGEGVRLALVDREGKQSQLDVDHVIAATGYRVDLPSFGIFPSELVNAVSTLEGSPRLTREFESSVPGLFFGGLAAAATFGPMMRFVCGSEFAGPRVADGVTARLRAS
jgi:thioredoxin reductase